MRRCVLWQGNWTPTALAVMLGAIAVLDIVVLLGLR